MEKITADNWTFMAYQSKNLSAILSLGATPGENGQADLLYYMTVMDEDGNDLYQEDFTDLPQAILKINTKYSHWSLVDRQENNSSGGGCGDCAAH